MQNLSYKFWIIDYDNVSYYFTIKININLKKKKISLWQSTYLKKISKQYDMTNFKQIKIFITPEVTNFFTSSKYQVKKNIISWY